MTKIVVACVMLLGCASIASAQTENVYQPMVKRTVSPENEGTGRILVGKKWVEASDYFADEYYAKIHNDALPTTKKEARIGWNSTPINPLGTLIDPADALTKQGETAFQERNFSAAETDFNQAIALNNRFSQAYLGLARVFTARRQPEKAIGVYYHVFYDLSLQGYSTAVPAEQEKRLEEVYENPIPDQFTADGLRYALLLNQNGQWQKAVAVYNSALRSVPGGDLPKINFSFNASDPQPAPFEAATCLALGLVLNFSAESDRNQKAMEQYARALQIEPDNAIANYYYGYGWQRLDPKDKAKVENAQQAEAALEKAVKIGKPDVKEAAQKALLVATKP